MGWIIGIYVVGVALHALLIGYLGSFSAEKFPHAVCICMFWPILFFQITGATWAKYHRTEL